MHRIDTSTKEVDKFGSGKHGFTEGDPSTSTPCTQVSDDWLDAVQEELIGPIEYLGRTPTKGEVNQLESAIKSMFGLLCAANMAQATHTKTQYLRDVEHDQSGLWVAVGDNDGVDGYILTSANGISWSEVAPAVPVVVDILGVAYDGNAGLWCAVGNAVGGDAYIITSPAGVVWTERANPSNVALNDVAHDQSGLWVAVGAAGSGGADSYIVTSADGAAWAERVAPVNLALQGICTDGAGTWIAAGAHDGTRPLILKSTNAGVTWTQITNIPSNTHNLWDVEYGNGVYVAVASSGYVYVSSDDGDTWTAVSVSAQTLRDVDYHDGIWIVCGGSDGVDGDIYTSTDNGATWVEKKNPQNLGLYGVAFDNEGTIVAVGEDDGVSTPYIVHSMYNPFA